MSLNIYFNQFKVKLFAWAVYDQDFKMKNGFGIF